MLAEFLEIDEKDTHNAGELQKALTILLRNQFIYAGDRGFAHHYEVLSRPINRKFVENLAASLAYHFECAETEGWCGLLPDTEELDGVLPKLSIRQSIVLLVCAHLWYEMFRDGDVVYETQVAVTTFNEFEALYQEMAAKGRTAAMNPTALETELAALERYHIVKLFSFNEEEQDRQLEIRPHVRVAAGEGYLKKLEKFSRSCEATAASQRVADGTDAIGDSGQKEGDSEDITLNSFGETENV